MTDYNIGATRDSLGARCIVFWVVESGQQWSFALVWSIGHKLNAAVLQLLVRRLSAGFGMRIITRLDRQVKDCVAPDLYMAFGNFLAPYSIGWNGKILRMICCGKHDEEAPIFQIADYGLGWRAFLPCWPNLLRSSNRRWNSGKIK